jgi:hypothetical protein
MIRIAITPAAFEAISGTPPLGIVGYEAEVNAKGVRPVRLERITCDKLARVHGPRESYSGVTLGLVKLERRR